MHAGNVIKFLRERAGMTQAELGKILDVNKSTIQKYENGMVQNLKIKTIRMLCNTFVVPSWYFIFPEKLTFKDEKTAISRLQQALSLVIMYDQLNDKGQERVYLYLKDISEISHYKKQTTAENIENNIQHFKEMLIGLHSPINQEIHENDAFLFTDDRAPSRGPDES